MDSPNISQQRRKDKHYVSLYIKEGAVRYMHKRLAMYRISTDKIHEKLKRNVTSRPEEQGTGELG